MPIEYQKRFKPSWRHGPVSKAEMVLMGAYDRRTKLARRFEAILADLVNELGGSPTTVVYQTCRRIAFLSIICTQYEEEFLNGEKLSDSAIAIYVHSSGAITRLMGVLGLSRPAPDATPPETDVRAELLARLGKLAQREEKQVERDQQRETTEAFREAERLHPVNIMSPN